MTTCPICKACESLIETLRSTASPEFKAALHDGALLVWDGDDSYAGINERGRLHTIYGDWSSDQLALLRAIAALVPAWYQRAEAGLVCGEEENTATDVEMSF